MKHWSRLLIVDDEPKAHTLIENLLITEGYVLMHAMSGKQALSMANDGKPDVILLDVMMPEMDGFEVCKRLRENPALRLVPVIMLTALDDRASRLKGLEAGADDYLSKPYDALELRARLRTITRLDRFRALYEERARFEALVNAAPDGIVVTDGDGTILLANPAFDELVEKSDEKRCFFDYLDASATSTWREAIAVRAPGETVPPLMDVTLQHSRHPGTSVEVTGCVQSSEGHLGYHFYVRDMTARRMYEGRLQRSQRIELLGQLAGGIVHDVNNLLTVIRGSAELLNVDEQDAKFAANIVTAATKGNALLRSILNFAKGVEPVKRAVDLSEVLEEVGSLVAGTLGRHYVVKVDAPQGLALIQADPSSLHQIVMNLCVNARDAMPDGGNISIGARQLDLGASEAAAIDPDAKAGRYVVLSVQDFGCGIPADVLPRLFDPFFSTKPSDKGTGLGLATVLRMVRSSGGFVTVKSEVGQGSTFNCYLPAAGAW